ncbi:hypothetical protein [Cupriavidus pinatubonensis]|uniref:Uncharacterized protein n=1 Tax=Cupriavidus pinatubonensis TaxID=248026 RepID=A0ABN7XS75_9BURK|nr:hypothetical protein [Cupriavidus pinatubonensis]CAG9163842.1 hypothetical protein LMG23994_00301 [Cupriavidus pinatubonensis]
MFPETLEKAANRLNKTAVYLGLPQDYSANRLLELAAHGDIRLRIVLPGPFAYISKNHDTYRPRLPDGFVLCIDGHERTYRASPVPPFPKGFDHLHISRDTAYKLKLHDGNSVDLRSVVNFRPDGETDEFHAEPGAVHLQVSIADLRIDGEELDRLIREIKASNASTTSAQQVAPCVHPLGNGSCVDENQANGHDSQDASVDWKKRAQELAQNMGAARWRRDGIRNQSTRSLSPAVAIEMAKDEYRKYWGMQGPRSESNIRNEALKGWKFVPPEDDGSVD